MGTAISVPIIVLTLMSIPCQPYLT